MMYEEILLNYIIRNTEYTSSFIEGECYKTLLKIKAILEDDSLSDSECFSKIEEIILCFEEIGAGIEYRHDF